MENNFNLSVILPLHTTLVKDFDEFFKKAIQSIMSQQVKPNELIIVHIVVCGYLSGARLNTCISNVSAVRYR